MGDSGQLANRLPSNVTDGPQSNPPHSHPHQAARSQRMDARSNPADASHGETAGVLSRCMECGETQVSPLVCTTCCTLRPPRGDFNHFVRLGLPIQYSIQPAELERRFLVLARGLHPDQFSLRPAEERSLAGDLSAQLNDSFKVIRDPLLRAEYLLELEGGPTRDQEKKTPPDFLMEMLELNEQIEEAKSEGGAGARDAMLQLETELKKRLDTIVQSLPAAFHELSITDHARRWGSLLHIREQLNMAAYLSGLVETIREWVDE